MPSAFLMIAALAASPQQFQTELAAAIETRNRHAVETMLAADPSCRVALAQGVRARLGVPSPPWMPLVIAWDPQSPRWPEGWNWPMTDAEAAQRWVQLGMRVATGRSQGSTTECFDRAMRADEAAMVTILGHFVNTTDANLQGVLWSWLWQQDGCRLKSHPDERIGALLSGLFDHPREDISLAAVAIWSLRGAREGGPQARDRVSTLARRIVKDNSTPIVLLFTTPGPPGQHAGPRGPICPGPGGPILPWLLPARDGEFVFAAAAGADAELAAAIAARRDEVLAQPTSAPGERAFWELCAIRASVKNPGIGGGTDSLRERLWVHSHSRRAYPTPMEHHDRSTALLALCSSHAGCDDLLDAVAAQPAGYLDAIALDLRLDEAQDALRPFVRRLYLKRAPALHAMVPDVLFDALREGGDRMSFAFDLLVKMANPTVVGLLREPAARERFLATYRKAPLHPSLEPRVRERVEALLAEPGLQPPRAAPSTDTSTDPIAATIAADAGVRLAAYRALAALDPAEHLSVWLLFEAPFDPDPRVRSLRLP